MRGLRTLATLAPLADEALVVSEPAARSRRARLRARVRDPDEREGPQDRLPRSLRGARAARPVPAHDAVRRDRRVADLRRRRRAVGADLRLPRSQARGRVSRRDPRLVGVFDDAPAHRAARDVPRRDAAAHAVGQSRPFARRAGRCSAASSRTSQVLRACVQAGEANAVAHAGRLSRARHPERLPACSGSRLRTAPSAPSPMRSPATLMVTGGVSDLAHAGDRPVRRALLPRRCTVDGRTPQGARDRGRPRDEPVRDAHAALRAAAERRAGRDSPPALQRLQGNGAASIAYSVSLATITEGRS